MLNVHPFPETTSPSPPEDPPATLARILLLNSPVPSTLSVLLGWRGAWSSGWRGALHCRLTGRWDRLQCSAEFLASFAALPTFSRSSCSRTLAGVGARSGMCAARRFLLPSSRPARAALQLRKPPQGVNLEGAVSLVDDQSSLLLPVWAF